MKRSHTSSAAALAAVALTLAVQTVPAQDQGTSRSDRRPTVAVMHFNNGAIVLNDDDGEKYDALRTGIADMLITELATNDSIRVVERDQLQKLIAEQNLSRSGRVDKQTAVQIGKVLGAHHMIFGGFVIDTEKRMRLDARAVNVETSQIEHVATVEDKGDKLLEMITALARKLNKGMKLPPIPDRDDGGRPGGSRVGLLQALTYYSRALEEEDQGNRKEAIRLYRAALQMFPEYEPAQRKLAMLEKPARGSE